MNRSICFVIFTLLVLAALPTNGTAQEWTRFRGPNGSGMSDTTFPARFANDDVAWNVALPGTGHSSPVVWGDNVFVTCTDESTAQRMVVCLSAKTGQLKWKKDYGSQAFKHHVLNSYASASPAVDATAVYVCWNTPAEYTLMALKHDGSELWRLNLGPMDSQHGCGNSPVLFGDLVILGDEQDGPSFVFGIDRATGKIVWKLEREASKGGYAYSTPAVFHPASGPDQLVFCSKAQGMYGIDPLTGKVLWQAPGIFDSRTVSSPAVGNGLIFGTCGEGPGGHVLVAVRPGNGKADVAWKTRIETPYVPTPLVKGDLLFYWDDRGICTCARAATGEIIWQKPTAEPPAVPGSFFCSPICAGNMLFSVSKKGDVVVLAADEKFAILGQTQLNDKCHATPAISGGRMFIRTYSRLFCIKGTGGHASR
jgi:outer membrane protein assembly factor BamB